MSITIQNMGPVGDADPKGRWHYEVRINDEVVAIFTHRRSKGLSACLRSAAAAVDSDTLKKAREPK